MPRSGIRLLRKVNHILGNFLEREPNPAFIRLFKSVNVGLLQRSKANLL